MQIRKVLWRTLALGVICGAGLFHPREAESIAYLSGSWSCSAYASCAFTRTSSNHATYQWSFGDGSFSGLTTAVTTNHNYNIPYGTTPTSFTVYLSGYATSGGGSPDNVVGCTITTYRTAVGGDPTTFSGTCT